MLSSDNDKAPYLYYRMAENIFCRSFDARNLARSDLSLDACKKQLGIGLKTFLYKNGKPTEKIAEFNRDRKFLTSTKEYDIAKAISLLRNKRLASTCGACGIEPDNMLYHCIAKMDGKFLVHETKINLIDIEGIKKQSVKMSGNIIKFSDGIEEYSYNISKSTLFQKFIIDPIDEITVEIFNDPYQILEQYLLQKMNTNLKQCNPIIETIFLPLYSEKGSIHVPERSGLNQWNAKGRPRNKDEVYISIPSAVNNKFPSFFPNKDTSFTLHLPNGLTLCAKVCQDNNKALMTDPNVALGEWILREVLSLEDGELATYEKLEEIGIDSVEINKFEDGTYAINFKGIGAFENFKQNYL